MFKKRVIMVLAVMLLAVTMLPLGFTQAASGDWVLVWSDEFNGTAGAGVDTTNWNYEIGGGGWGNGELEYYTNRTENVYIEQDPDVTTNKYLVIKAIKEVYENCNYTSGRITTQGKREFAYGKIEMRAKLPYGQGIWPAFWMLGNDIGTVGWPACGELDIMEFVGSTPTKTYGTLHGPDYSGSGGLGTWHTYTPGYTSDWHTYGVEWEPGIVRWYFDGQMFQLRTVSDLAGRTWVFNHPFFIILNLAVGGAWPGVPDATTVFPQYYKIDYARVYQRQDGVYPPLPYRNLVAMKSVSSKRYARCNINSNPIYLLTADSTAVSTPQIFELIDLGNGNTAIICVQNYKYATLITGSQLIGLAETIGPNETYQLITNTDGTKSFKCLGNGKYITVDRKANMWATATSIGSAEKFNFETK